MQPTPFDRTETRNPEGIFEGLRAPRGQETQGANGSIKHSQDAVEREVAGWPDPPDSKAYYGPMGDLVRAIEPHTEADPVAILGQGLIQFGNLIGRTAYFPVEADRHYSNEALVLVGDSSKGRKGTAESRVRAPLSVVDENWASNRILGGLSSGEGLIWAVHDPITKHEALREHGKVVGYQDVEVDAGVNDKRLLIVEPELASVLRQLERDGNILSAILRQAWDKGHLRTLTKNSPAVATGAHVSVIGHITLDELRRYFSATEQANGFGNRFLWFCVKRSKFLPEGGDLERCQRDLEPVIQKLKAAAEFARGIGPMSRNEDARKIWARLYRDLSGGKYGLSGAVTNRAEAHVVRLSCLYALLDKSSVVGVEHLEAATALWEFAEASCEFIFGDATGNPEADTILKALRGSPKGISRTELNALFKRNKPAHVISKAINSLISLGLARSERRSTEGRPSEILFAL